MSTVDPWERFGAERAAGDVLSGVVTHVAPFGAFVEVGGCVGLVPQAPPVEVGQPVTVSVLEIDASRRRFSARMV